MILLERLNKEFKKTIVMVTHDHVHAEKATVTHHLDKGECHKERYADFQTYL